MNFSAVMTQISAWLIPKLRLLGFSNIIKYEKNEKSFKIETKDKQFIITIDEKDK